MARSRRRAAMAVLPALAVLAVTAATAPPQALAQAVDCPGAQPACVYTTQGQIGQSAGGVLRFPQAVAVAGDGTVYVGDQGSHVVSVFDSAGQFVRQIGIPGSRPGQLSAVGALALAGDGTLLVADGANRIDRFSAEGALLNSFGSPGTAVGEFRFGGGRGNDAGAGGGLAASGSTVYVADSGNDRIQRFNVEGGNGAVIVPSGQLAHPKGLAVRGTRLFVADDQNHRIVVMDTGGKVLTTIGAGGKGPAPGQLNFPYGVVTDPGGRVFVADNLNQRIVRYSTGPSYPYKARWGSYGTGPGQLAYPRGIAADRQGMVYVANTGNDRIDVFDRSGTPVRSFGTSGRGNAQFNTPSGVAADAQGFRAVTDAVNGRVQFFAPDGSLITSWGSPAPGPTILPRPVAVAFDGNGNAYVLDQRRARIVVFDRQTGLPTRTIATQGSGAGQLLDPSALAISPGGTIWVADSGNTRLARFGLDGSYQGSAPTSASPRGVALSPDGARVYVTDARSRITVLNPDGSFNDEFGGRGTKLGKLEAPGQLTIDAAGNLWVADRGNNRIQQFGPGGERLASFGSRGTGPGQMINPTGVAVDCNGILTITDTANNRVQQFTLAAPAAAGTCIPLAPLGTPPPPKLPTLPMPDGPQVTLRALRTGGLLSSRNLPLRAGCDTTCKIAVELRIAPRARPAKGKKLVTVKLSATTTVSAGNTTIVRPRLSAKQVRALRKALRGRRGLQADVQLVATASVGQPTTVTQRLNATS